MAKQQEWYWNDKEYENQDIEIPIVLKLSKNTAAMVISEILGFKSMDEYVSDMVRVNVRRELGGIGNFEREHIEEIEKEMELIDR